MPIAAMSPVARAPLAPPLNFDGTLGPLVLFLFVGSWLFFNSLVAGVQTTRVVARVARAGCRDPSILTAHAAFDEDKSSSKKKKKAAKRRGSNAKKITSTVSLLPSGIQAALRFVRAFNQLVAEERRKPSREQAPEASVFAQPQAPQPQPADAVDSDPNAPPRWGPVRRFFVSYCLPYRWMSFLWGKLTRVPLRFDWLKRAVFMAWTKTYNCQLHEMRHPLTHYASLSEFFLRPLKDGARSVHKGEPGAMASPVDGKVMHVGRHGVCCAQQLEAVFLEQVKGVTYSFVDFVGEKPAGLEHKADPTVLHTLVAYLAPGDYHHFHSPADWRIEQRRHFPGNLLPVRPWAVRELPGLYCANERVALNGSWKHGFMSFVAVGALNVGSIDLAFEPELCTNQGAHWPFALPAEPCLERSYVDEGKPVAATTGERLGDFNLGSTVVLVFEAPADFEFCVEAGDVLRMGQRVGGVKQR